jgi:hypothetical protein
MSYYGNDAGQSLSVAGRIFGVPATGVRLKLEDFMSIISKSEEPLVIVTCEGFFTKLYKYVTAYKGFVFFTESLDRLDFSSNTEVIQAQSILSDI